MSVIFVPDRLLAYDRAGGLHALQPVMLSIDIAPLRARRMLARLIASETDAIPQLAGCAW